MSPPEDKTAALFQQITALLKKEEGKVLNVKEFTVKKETWWGITIGDCVFVIDGCDFPPPYSEAPDLHKALSQCVELVHRWRKSRAEALAKALKGKR